MSFVDEEDVIAGCAGKKPFQIYGGIEDMIIIADDDIRPRGRVVGQCEWTDMMGGGDGLQSVAIDCVEFEGGGDGGFGSIVIAQSARACARVARSGFGQAEFFASSQGEGTDFEAGAPQFGESGLGDGAPDGFCGEIKDLGEFFLGEDFDAGKQDGNGFSDAGGSFSEEFKAIAAGAIASDGEEALAGSIFGEREGEAGDGLIAGIIPVDLAGNPGEIRFGDGDEEFVELGPGMFFAEGRDLIGFEFQVAELDFDDFNSFALEEEGGVEFCLGPMERIRRAVPSAGDCFNLLDEQTIGLAENAVDPAIDDENKSGAFEGVGNGDFWLVTFGLSSLQALVAFSSIACPGGTDELAISMEVAGAQNKLDQVPHGDGNPALLSGWRRGFGFVHEKIVGLNVPED